MYNSLSMLIDSCYKTPIGKQNYYTLYNMLREYNKTKPVSKTTYNWILEICLLNVRKINNMLQLLQVRDVHVYLHHIYNYL